MKKKFFVILIMMLLIITAFHTTTGSKINTQKNTLEIKIEINQPNQEQINLNDPIEMYEGQHLQLTITGYWEPPNPTKTICLWADDTTMPEGATLTPPCHCEPGEVSSILEWTPALGQAGTYVITFYLGEYCEVPLKSFSITIIVHPVQNNPPVVTITSPADGSVVTEQHITIHGLVTDDNGIISIGSHHEWDGGEATTSGTLDPAETYYPFDWAFDLYEGWNRITIFVTDGENPAEDSIYITYNPGAGIIPGITFNQVEYRFEDGSKISDSYMGEIKLHMPTVCEYFEEGTGYLNVFTDLGWIVQNMWISLQYMNDGIPYMATKFHLREGPVSGININTIDAYIEFSTTPTGEFYGELLTTYPVGNTYAYFEGNYFTPILPDPLIPPCFPTLFCNQTNHSNVQTACNQCGPAACANSLHYLQDQYPDRIDVPHELIPGLGRTADQKPIPPESTVSQLDLAMRRPNVVNRQRGGLIYAFEFIEGKLRYLNDTGLGQCINVKHQGQYVARNYTIGNLTSRNRGKDGSKVTTEFIFSEICNGEDVELLLAWPGGGGHYVDVTGVGLVCGKLK